ncbi:MAG TPA: hypothetical protein VH593_25210 [Ktedonobacteraceae bacterium]|jgi:hypothetical protein
MDDKYIVFKRGDAISVTDGYTTFKSNSVIDDAVVIRRQDIFAPPAFDAYANSILVALSLDPEAIHSDYGQRMQEIADYFHEQAVLAWDTNRKIPD